MTDRPRTDVDTDTESRTTEQHTRRGNGSATRVEWHSWGPTAFETARTAQKPILLSLSATWCEPCHEMDRETYAVPTIAANINDDFVPIRVDVDRQPRVRDRYNMGGFPSTVFLTPDGKLLTGAGYLEEDSMRQVIDSIRTLWRDKGTTAGRVPRALRDDEPPAGDLSPEIESQMLGQLTESYDEVAGGWGTGPKFPLPDALEFALKRDREMALRSFDAVSANLLDEHDGGFYRFGTERDWSGIHHEKLLDENAALLRAFANAYLTTGQERYLEPATRTLEYLTTTLWTDAEAFAGSQAPGDQGAYTLEASDREAADEPPIDPTVYAGPNALAVGALCTYYAYTDEQMAKRYAMRTLESICDRLVDDGSVIHYRDDVSESEGERDLLVNQARVLGALTTAWSTLGAGGADVDFGLQVTARTVAETTIDRLRDGDSFLDGSQTGSGLLDRPLRPLDANAVFADGLLELSVLTGDDRYRTVAQETLEAFAGASDRFGPQVARYATVAARLQESPLVIRVGSPAGSDLHRAAMRVADHEKIVIPDADLEAGRARAEVGDQHSATAETPAALSEAVKSILE